METAGTFRLATGWYQRWKVQNVEEYICPYLKILKHLSSLQVIYNYLRQRIHISFYPLWGGLDIQ